MRAEPVVSIPNEAGWPTASFDQICSLISRGGAPHYVEHSEVRAIGQRCVAAAGFEPSFARPHSTRAMEGVLVAETGDVLLNSTGTGTIGRSCVFLGEGTFIVDGHVTLLRPEPDRSDGRWLNALLRTPWGQSFLETQCYAGSTNQVELSRTRLAAARAPIPPLPEQRQIAAILDTIDDAIRKTERIIAKLKQVKQGLLHDLLIRGIDDDGELRDPARHPDRFKDSPLGRIPMEWVVARLERHLDGPPKNGHSPMAVDEWTGRLMLGLGCLSTEGFAPLQLKNAPRHDSRLDAAALRNGDLLLSRANTRELVGLAGIYSDVGMPCTYPDLMMRLTPLARSASSEFLELVLRSPPLRKQIQAAAVGTSVSMVKISGSIVRSLIVALPTLIEQSRILASAKAGKQRATAESFQLEKLRVLKSGLMDDLLTGRVRVNNLLDSAAP